MFRYGHLALEQNREIGLIVVSRLQKLPCSYRSSHRDYFRKSLSFSSNSTFFWSFPGDRTDKDFPRSLFRISTNRWPIFRKVPPYEQIFQQKVSVAVFANLAFYLPIYTIPRKLNQIRPYKKCFHFAFVLLVQILNTFLQKYLINERAKLTYSADHNLSLSAHLISTVCNLQHPFVEAESSYKIASVLFWETAVFVLCYMLVTPPSKNFQYF